jgi:hypothetical protein
LICTFWMENFVMDQISFFVYSHGCWTP